MHERSGGAPGAQEVDDQVEDLRVQDGRGLKVFAGCGSAGEDEYAGSDDRADAQRGQRPRAEGFAKTVFGVLGFGDQLVDGLAAEELVAVLGGSHIVGGGWWQMGPY